MIVGVKEMKGRDRVMLVLFPPHPKGPKSWAKEESIMSAMSTMVYQESSRVKPCLSWVYWTRRGLRVKSKS